MRRFVNDYIQTLGASGVARASSILDNLKLEKSNLAIVASRLEALPINTAMTIPEETIYTRIRASKNTLAFRDIKNTIGTLYDESNLISLLIDGYSNALISDVRALDSEVTALEKALSNYAFLLSDGGSYDCAFMEAFNDELNRDFFDFDESDRAGLIFDKLEQAVVNTEEGVLNLADVIDSGYPLTGQVIASNCSGLEESNTGIRNAVDKNLSRAWRIAVATTRALTSTLKEFKGLHGEDSWTGAQYVVEFDLGSPSPTDTITISPCTEYPFELTQVALLPLTTSAEAPKFVLNTPLDVTKTMSVHFPMQTVQRVRLYIRQPTFLVSEYMYGSIEDDHAVNYAAVLNQWSKNRAYSPHFVDREDDHVSCPEPYDFRDAWEVNAPANQLYRDDRISNPYVQFDNDTPLSRYALDIIGNGLMNVISTGMVPLPIKGNWAKMDGFKIDSDVNADDPIRVHTPTTLGLRYLSPRSTKDPYRYYLGIHLIRIGLSTRGYKGVFISKPIAAPGDMGEIKIKTGDTSFSFQDSDKDMPLATFVEYSVTNKSTPKREDDWVPILPIDHDGSIEEFFMVNETGLGLLRFPASVDDSIIMYKNGYRVDRTLKDMLVKAENKRSIIGLQLPLGFATKEDNLIVTYTPTLDPKLVNFETAGLGIPPLASSHDEGEAGESYNRTNADLTVNLRFSPYIDYSSVDDSTYDSTYGLSPYSPIIIVLEDGTVPINLTNYKGGDQSALDPTAEAYQYVHNQNVLLFNQAITTSFKVYYQYLPNNVRFRVILRSIVGAYISPTVDWIQMKGKTRKPDPKRV